MKQTKHFLVRLKQRGFSSKMVDLCMEFGEQKNDKIFLNVKGIDSLVSSLNDVKKNLLRIRNKGGITIVTVDDNLITLYNFNSKGVE